jgi:UDP-hydrolysing UDP-N-acetyl-D-glucosamine 2-epimerase
VVSGAPGLDNIRNVTLLTRDEIKLGFGLDVSRPFLLVTYHPVTLEPEHTVTHIDELISALDATPHDVLFTYPNADTESRKIVERIEKFCARNPKAKLAVNLGTQGYFSVMSHALAMVGNSSSGIIEAASFKLPVINIGNRQRGRVCGKNVLHCGTTHAEILNAIFEAISPDFAAALADLRNPYGDGNASERIVKTLREAELGPELLMKRFHELHF